MISQALLWLSLSLGQAPPVQVDRATLRLPTLHLTSPQDQPQTKPKEPESKEESKDSEEPKAPERYLIMKLLDRTRFADLFERQRLQISGWTHMSFTASSRDRNQLPMGFNYQSNEFLLQQHWLRLERTVVTEDASGPTIGFRTDVFFGSDYRFTVARGLFDGQLTSNDGQAANYGVDPIQFYAEAYFPNIGKGLDVKLGRFFAQYGVEANDAPSNALLSHAYTFIYNPFTHTGLLGTLKLSDTWSVQSGIVAGSDVFIDPASEPTYIGGVKWAPSEGKSTAQFAVILGSGRFNQRENFHNPQVFDWVFTRKISDDVNYTFEGLYGFTTNVPGTGFANWLGVLNYVTYTMTPKLSNTTRLEFFYDAQGQRTGFSGLYTVLTSGLAYKPWNSVILRPELRIDYNRDSRPFENNHGLFTAATDLILRW